MSQEMIDVTCPSCHKKNLLLKRLTKGTYRCSHCKYSLSNPFISSISQTQSSLKGGKLIGFSVLVSVGLLVSFARSALGSSPSPPLSSAPVTSQPKAVPHSPIVMAKN